MSQAPGISRAKRLFFLHIPKTAGSSVNAFFADIVGRESCLVHLESQRGAFGNPGTDIFRDVQFASGHLPFEFIRQHLDLDSWTTMTVLRDPIDQIGSHLRWLKHVGSEPGSKLLQGHTPLIQQMALRLNELSLNDVGAMKAFVFDEFPQARQLFDNCQVRYLQPPSTDRVDAEMSEGAIRAIGNIRHVLFVERLQTGLARVVADMGWKHPGARRIRRENAGPVVEPLNLQDRSVREFYDELVRWDVKLYRSVFRSLAEGGGRLPGNADRARSASYSR